MNIKPTGFLVIVKPDALPKQSAGGIALPYKQDPNYDTGVVKAIGPDVNDTIGIKVGDHVLYHQDQKQIFDIESVRHYIMDSRLIDAIVEEDCRIE